MKRNKDKVTVDTKGNKVFSKGQAKKEGMRPQSILGFGSGSPVYIPKKGKGKKK